MRLSIGLLLLAGLAGLSAPARAQAPLARTAQNAGQRVCQAQGVCECSYFAGGLMFRDPPGYRWDCSLTRGTCVGDTEMPILSRLTTPGPLSRPVALPGRANAAGRGEASVRFAQADLKRHGFDPGPVDGVLGRRTRGAITQFQRSARLPATGTLTPETIQSLRR
jgi:hypothetical protein